MNILLEGLAETNIQNGELIEETGGLIFGMWGYFWPGSDKFEFWKKKSHI